MFGGLNPKKIQEAMKKMGINQQEIEAKRVVIEQEDKNIVIENPSIVKINMSGQESFQITGEVSEEEQGISKEDIKIVMEKTECSEEEAKKALEAVNGDLTEAIINLSK